MRAILVELAAKRLGVDAATLGVADGVIGAPDGRKVSYGELARDADLHREATAQGEAEAAVAAPDRRQADRSGCDIPGKVTGGVAYVQDLRLPGMLMAGWCVRPQLRREAAEPIDASRRVEGDARRSRVVRDGSFLGVIAEREEQAIKASVALAESARWTAGPPLPDQAASTIICCRLPSEDKVVNEKQARAARRREGRRGDLSQALHGACLDRAVLRGRAVRATAR